MLKITCIFLCVVAAALTKVSALTDEDKNAIHEAMAPIIAECSAEHGVSEGDIKAAKESHNTDGIKACFIGCIMKKADMLDSKGLYDVDKCIAHVKKYVKNAEDLAKFETVAKQCAKVNDEPVSDGDAGCERAKLLMTCVLEHKVELQL